MSERCYRYCCSDSRHCINCHVILLLKLLLLLLCFIAYRWMVFVMWLTVYPFRQPLTSRHRRIASYKYHTLIIFDWLMQQGLDIGTTCYENVDVNNIQTGPGTIWHLADIHFATSPKRYHCTTPQILKNSFWQVTIINWQKLQLLKWFLLFFFILADRLEFRSSLYEIVCRCLSVTFV